MKALKRLLKRSKLVRDALEQRHIQRSADLRAIEQLILPLNNHFPARREAAECVEGMLSPFSMAVMDMLLGFQEESRTAGDIMEIGTYKGKSAVILGGHLRSSEQLVLIDITEYLDPKAIAPFKDATDFILSSSDKLRSVLPNYKKRRGTFRFIHIDASHGYEETFAELEMAEELLGGGGIIAMDDFANLHYSQNVAAIFKYLFTTRTRLTPFVVTDEKAYLCHRSDLDRLSRLVLETGLAELKARAVSAVLARTSFQPEYKAFYLRPRGAEDESSFYGESIYSRQLVGW